MKITIDETVISLDALYNLVTKINEWAVEANEDVDVILTKTHIPVHERLLMHGGSSTITLRDVTKD